MAKRIRSVARRAGRAVAQGLKGTAISGGTGVASYYVHKMAAQKIGFLNGKPLVAPLALIAGGHFLKRRMPQAGTALCGAGGYALGMAIDVMRANAAAPGGTNALLDPSDVRALTAPSDIMGVDLFETDNVVDVPAGTLAIDDAMGL